MPSPSRRHRPPDALPGKFAESPIADQSQVVAVVPGRRLVVRRGGWPPNLLREVRGLLPSWSAGRADFSDSGLSSSGRCDVRLGALIDVAPRARFVAHRRRLTIRLVLLAGSMAERATSSWPRCRAVRGPRPGGISANDPAAMLRPPPSAPAGYPSPPPAAQLARMEAATVMCLMRAPNTFSPRVRAPMLEVKSGHRDQGSTTSGSGHHARQAAWRSPSGPERIPFVRAGTYPPRPTGFRRRFRSGFSPDQLGPRLRGGAGRSLWAAWSWSGRAQDY